MNPRAWPFLWLVLFSGWAAGAADVATLDQAIASGRDFWGEAALRQPNGPTYEFFEKLLPPLRYVDAPFRHYPIVLSAAGAAVKGRLVRFRLSDGWRIKEAAGLLTDGETVDVTGTAAVIWVTKGEKLEIDR